MTHFAIELVPRELAEFERKIQLIMNTYSDMKVVNIPDLKRLSCRSWEAAFVARKYCTRVIPHLRALDFDLGQGFGLAKLLIEQGITELLIISGDDLTNSNDAQQTTVVQMIKYLKSHYPEFTVYAAVDPYRQSLKKEMSYIQEKLDAGVDGFFTQPFFDINLLQLYLDMLSDYTIFYGVSPVTSERSKEYWENINDVIFPADFEPSIAWNTQFAQKAVKLIKEQQKDIYFMPIKEDESKYLAQVFSTSES